MTIRLSTSSFAGTGRTLVAVGTVRLAVMFAAVRAAAPRSRTTCSTAAPPAGRLRRARRPPFRPLAAAFAAGAAPGASAGRAASRAVACGCAAPASGPLPAALPRRVPRRRWQRRPELPCRTAGWPAVRRWPSAGAAAPAGAGLVASGVAVLLSGRRRQAARSRAAGGSRRRSSTTPGRPSRDRPDSAGRARRRATDWARNPLARCLRSRYAGWLAGCLRRNWLT